ncbi:MAG: hypothetical protein QOI04_1018 [Verrucomicrobiota bacterium]
MPRQLKAKPVLEPKTKPVASADVSVTTPTAQQTRSEPTVSVHPANIQIRKAEAVTPHNAIAKTPAAPMPAGTIASTQPAAHKSESNAAKPTVAPTSINAATNKSEPAPSQPAVASTKKPTSTMTLSTPLTTSVATISLHKPDAAISHANAESETAPTIPASMQTAFTKLADGFDFPVGKPDAQGYYKARGFRSHGHLGEDWDGVGGGDTDLGDPIYSIGEGIVVFSRDCHMGWGNVIIVRHTFRENGAVKYVDALYGHLQTMIVHRGQTVTRGQKIATMGTAHGLYDAHLHLEIRKNIEIGMSRAAFARDFNNYYDPSSFIASHRHLATSTNKYRVAMNTFTHDAKINFDKARNYTHSHSGGGSGESAANLKKALAAQSSH